MQKMVLTIAAFALLCIGIIPCIDAGPDDRPGRMPPNGFGAGGMPPEGAAGMNAPPEKPDGMQPGGATDASSYKFNASRILDGENASETDGFYTSNTTDTSAIYVINKGNLVLRNPDIKTSGDTSSNDASSFYGLNAAVLATSGSTVQITGGSVTTTGTGANGVFSTGKGTTINLTDVSINCTGDGGHGVDATLEGVLNLKDVDMVTSGSHGAAIATDRGSGTINVIGGKAVTYGVDSPGIYSTGVITVKDAIVSGIGAEGAVIEGKNTIALTNTTLNCGTQKTGGIMIYQSFSGDAEEGTGNFIMNGGSISAEVGPVFYVTNTEAEIKLYAVNITSASGVLIKAEATDRWGQSGSNGGIVAVTASEQKLSGDIVIDNISTVEAALQNSTTLTGSINAGNSRKSASLAIDASSTWNVTADSYLTGFSDGDSTLKNIQGNGHTVYYDRSLTSNSWLGAKTYSLNNGGELKPEE